MTRTATPSLEIGLRTQIDNSYAVEEDFLPRSMNALRTGLISECCEGQSTQLGVVVDIL